MSAVNWRRVPLCARPRTAARDQILSAAALAALLFALPSEGAPPIRVQPPGSAAYTVEAQVRFDKPGTVFRLEAGGELEAVADAQDASIGLRLLVSGKPTATETERLKPAPHKGWGAGAEDEIAREAASMPGWRNRWFTARVEVGTHSAWFWFDGRAIGELPLSGALAAITFHTPEGGSIRGVRTLPAMAIRGGFQPLDLSGYDNSDAPAGAPSLPTRMGGIPFSTSGRAIDVSQAGLRIRKKPRGPGSLYGNPFNFISAMDGDPLTILLRVPKRYYRRAWLLCDAAEGLSPKLTVRLARYRGEGGAFFADTEVTVPRSGGRPRLVEVPLDSGAMQDILAADTLLAQGNRSEVLKLDATVPWMEIELTSELRADLNCMLPLGAKSGVRLYGITLEESPLKLVATSAAAGHVFETGRPVRFNVALENVTAVSQRASIEIRARDREGIETRRSLPVTLAAGAKRTEPVELSGERPGKYDVSFELVDARGQRMVRHQTTFAVLPPDTRRAERDSPFGLWSWGGAHLTPPNDVEALLMRKAGARFTLGVNYPSKHKYGIGTGTDSVIGVFYTTTAVPGDPEAAAREMVETMKSRDSNPRYWQIYWEDAISERHHNRYPPSVLGRPPMELNEAERARLKAYWDRAEAYAREVRRQLPGERLALGAFANFTEEFLRRGFPKQYLDAISIEATAFRMQPERQPSVDDVHGLYFIDQWKKMYGYQGLDTIMVESLFRGTAPGYLSERDQANYYVRDFLLGLAYGVKLFGMSAMLADTGDDYHRSNWGNVGLFHRAPEPGPKESFVAYSTMTSVLDQARYQGYLDTGSTSVYALRFLARDGENLYALWTTRGRRPVELKLDGAGRGEWIDAMHRRRPLTGTRLTLSESVVYLKTAARLTAIRAGEPSYAEQPPPGAIAVDALDTLRGWRQREARDPMLEDGNPRYPRRAGAFTFTEVKDPARGAAIEVVAKPIGGSPLLPMYGVLERRQPVPLPGQPRRLGLWVKGNSGWGRITFELVDAKGERWTGVGGSEDSYGHGFVNFDNWRWVEVDLPGHFRKDYPWPYNGNWTTTGGDGIVDYPVALSRILIEARDQVVYVNSLAPVRNPAIRLRDLRAIY